MGKLNGFQRKKQLQYDTSLIYLKPGVISQCVQFRILSVLEQMKCFIEHEDLSKDNKKYKKSIPEYIDETTVYDAKYKYLPERTIQQVSDDDLNKLIRDMVVFEKKRLEHFVFPRPIENFQLNKYKIDTVI